MALKIISFIFVVSLVFGFQNPTQVKDVPFDVNNVINQVSPSHFQEPNPQNLNSPHLTGEFLIDTNSYFMPAPYSQSKPSVTFDGTNYFVVWDDLRSGSNIYGCRVNQYGVIIDTAGIVISPASRSQYYPSVVFDGTNYMVVWQNTSDIYGARVSQEGILLDPNGIGISTAPDDQMHPSITFDGTNFLVAWQDYRSGYDSDIYGSRVTQSGIVLDPNGFVISIASNFQMNPSIAFNGSNSLVVWEDWRSDQDRDIYGCRVNQAGIVLDPDGIPISTLTEDQRYPAVTFNSNDYLVVWQDSRNNSSDIYGSRLNQAGEVIDPNGIPVSVAAGEKRNPSVSFDGTNYLVVWEDNRNGYFYDIYGARINQAGIVIDPLGILISDIVNNQMCPSITFGNINYLVVWEDRRSGINDIYGTRVNQFGNVIDPSGIIISTTNFSFQFSPSITFGNLNYLIVWEDWRNTSDIYGARVSQEGIILDPNDIAISITDGNQFGPSVAFDGTNYLVVWEDNRNGYFYDIYCTRINQSGIVLDPTGIEVSPVSDSTDQTNSSVTFDGTNYFVVWCDYQGLNIQIYGARISQYGIILDPNGIPISTTGRFHMYPSVAFDGTNYLVVWQDWRNYQTNGWDIYGARVNQEGVILDTNGIAISNSASDQYYPKVAFDGMNYFVVWEDWRSDSSVIFGTRVSQSGVVLDSNGIAISTGEYDAASSIAFDGINYIVVWGTSDIHGAKINPTGIILEYFEVSAQLGRQSLPALAHGQGNQMLITYYGWTDYVNTHPANAYRIWGKFYPFIDIDEENSSVKMQSAKLLEVYPNPATGVVCVRGPLIVKEVGEIKIFDVSGKLVKEKKVTSARSHNQEVRISLKGIHPGIYFLQFETEIRKLLVVR